MVPLDRKKDIHFSLKHCSKLTKNDSNGLTFINKTKVIHPCQISFNMSSFAHFVQHAHFILFLDFHTHNLQSMNDASDRLRISSGILPVNMFCLKKKHSTSVMIFPLYLGQTQRSMVLCLIIYQNPVYRITLVNLLE